MSINCEIFISYSSKEKEIASLVRETLENNGITCWMAPESIPASSGYAAEITEAIANAKVVVLILSYPSMESKWVAKEVDFAICENKPIIPFRIDDSKLNRTFQLYLNNVQHIDAYKRIKMALGDLLDNVTALIGAKKEDSSRIYLKPAYREPIYNFMGRDRELEDISAAFDGHTVVALSGMGGIGKSEVAKAYAVKAYKDGLYEIVSYADYKGTLKKTISQLDFANFDEATFLESLQTRTDITSIEDELYKKKVGWLETHSKKALLIIDGMDNYDDPDLGVLSRISIDVLMTTRCHFSDLKTVRINPVPDDELVEVFYNFYEDGTRDEEEIAAVKEIISLVSSHTLTVKLMGQFLQTSGYEVNMLLDNLRQSTLSDIFGQDEVMHQNRYDSINAHIKNLFSLAKLSQKEEAVLADLSLIPTSGIKKYTFRSWHKDADTMTVVSRLVDKGFVESNHGLIYLHPIIQAVVKDTVKPNTDLCADFLDCVIQNIDGEIVPTVKQMDELSAITLSIVNSLNEENLTMVRLLTSVGRFHNSCAYCKLMPLKNYRGMNTAFAQLKTDNVDKLKEFSVSHGLYLRAGQMLEGLEGVDWVDRERLYTRFAALLYNVKKYDDAILYNQKALDINVRERGVLDENSFTNRRRMATCYFTVGNFQKAYELYAENLRLRLENPPQEAVNLGRAQMHAANALKALGRLDEALTLYERSREYIVDDDSNAIGLAMLDEEVADLYERMGNAILAKDYLKEALDLYTKFSEDEEKINILSQRLEGSAKA